MPQARREWKHGLQSLWRFVTTPSDLENSFEAMFALAEKIGFPTRLEQVPGFNDDHITRALAAAKNPQLKMKLQNMPVPLTAEMIDEYMSPILEAARDGDLSRIKNVNG